jgi:fibronectin type 3 domain-containing protein
LGAKISTNAAVQNPLALPAVGDSELRILSPNLLELSKITTKDPDPAPVVDWNIVGANFALALPPAANFKVTVNGQEIAVSAVGFKRRPLYAPLKARDLRIENSLFLQLASNIPDNATVQVKDLSGVLWNEPANPTTVVADPLRWNPAIHANQTSYSPAGPKKGMVGYYLGSLGEMNIASTVFNIVEAGTGQVVFTGQLKLRPDVGYTYSPLPYQKVYEADFTALQSEGEFVLQAPGLGASFPFLIDRGSAAAFARAYALGLYHQRCGMKNELPFSRFEHDVCHAAPAEIPDMTFDAVNRELAGMSSDYNLNPLHTAPQLKDVNASLYPFVNKNPVDVRGGHHDAGDYSKYTINSAGLIHHLVFAADNFGQAGKLDNLGMPESSDGKSDLLQEAKWEADFLARLQDSDGGFYFLVYPRNREYEDNVLPDHGDSQVVFPKNTAATAAAVGALAEIASSPAFKTQFPAESAAYLAKARLGWDFLSRAIAAHGKNGSYQKITHYGNEFMHDDELAWAAAALFVATGESQFHLKLKEWYDPTSPDTKRWTWWRLFEGYGCAARAYAFAVRSGRLPAGSLDAAYLAKCESEIIGAGDDIARFAEQTAYGTSFPDPNKAFRSAGWYFSMERAFETATAYQLNPQPRYLQAIYSNQAYEAGCNPVNVSYLTGLGWKRWREIVHQYAQNDYRVLPPSGLPLGNIQGGFAYLENYKQELGRLAYPPDGATDAPYPYYDRFGDSFNTTTEFVIVDQARSLATAAFLMSMTGDFQSASKGSYGVITGLPSISPAETEVAAAFEAPGVDLSHARIVWEAADQQPFIGQTFHFAPKNPGAQWVEVEAQLPDGRRIYARTNFMASYSENLSGNSYQSAPLTVSNPMVGLYHFDNSLADSSGKLPDVALSGAAALDAMNLGWMRLRSGTALRISDLGDNAKVTIPGALLCQAGATTEITVEAMVYVHAYKAWNRSTARLVSLERGWNASLAWSEDIYTGPHARGGTQFDFFGAALQAAMPIETWHHLSISISNSGYALRVNGTLVASVPSGELANWNGGSALLEIGNFDGWIDELVIRNGPLPAAANQPPTATISSPASGASFPASASIALQAAVSDPDGSVAKVEFFDASQKIGEATSAPWIINWSPAAGIHQLSAQATDNLGATAASTVIQITVQAANLPPSVALTKPGQGAIFNVRSSFLMEAAATDADGSVQKVEFYDGANKLGEALAPAWQLNITSLPVGSHALTAAAIDNSGARTVSAPISIQVVESVPIPPANLAAIANGATRVDLAWSDLADNESGYRVYRSTDGALFVERMALGANQNAWSDLSCAPDTRYYYAVRAFNSAGESMEAIASTRTQPQAPLAPAGLIATLSGSSVNLAWNSVAGAATYRIQRSLSPFGPFDLIASNLQQPAFTDAAPPQDATVYYAVTASNSAGESPISNIASALVATSPSAPMYLRLSASRKGQIILNWTDASNNETRFSIERSTNGKLFSAIASTGANEASWVDASIQSKSTYYYRVRAWNASGWSAYSNSAFVRAK